MSHSVSDHRLQGSFGGQPVQYEDSPNHNNGTIRPTLLVYHYTACSFAVARAAFMRAATGNPVSAHLLVDSDGSVTQFVDFNRRAWHAGESAWGTLSDINTHSIGIEVVNYGYLMKTASGGFRLSDGSAAPFPVDEVVEARHKHASVPYQYWHGYTPEQIETCSQLAEILVATYPVTEIVGHDDIAPTRKVDPGPAFPLIKVSGRAFGRDMPQDGIHEIVKVATAMLNIRRGPGIQHEMAGAPLPAGTRLEVMQRQGDWISVQIVDGTGRSGWVAARYVSV